MSAGTGVDGAVDDAVDLVAHDAVDAPRPGRRRLVVLLVAGGVVAAAVLTWLVAFSPVLGVRRVTVRGANGQLTAQVRTAAKIVRGTPVIRVDTAAVTRRVEQLPDVASAQVSTSLPATVLIVVIERVPVAFVESGGHDTLVDRTGTGYRAVASAPDYLPRLVASSSKSTAAALAAVAAALPAVVRTDVVSIQALDPGSITLLLHHHRIVRWGDASRTADKARVLPVLLRSADDQIDVSDPDQPFTH